MKRIKEKTQCPCCNKGRLMYHSWRDMEYGRLACQTCEFEVSDDADQEEIQDRVQFHKKYHM